MTPNRKYFHASSAWQTTLVDLLALLLCFIVLQYALGLPTVPTPTANGVTKRAVHSTAARNWFMRQNIPQVALDRLDAHTMHLSGNVNMIEAAALNQLKCSFHIVEPPNADLALAQSALTKLRATGLSIPSGLGIDSRIKKLTMIIDLENCQ